MQPPIPDVRAHCEQLELWLKHERELLALCRRYNWYSRGIALLNLFMAMWMLSGWDKPAPTSFINGAAFACNLLAFWHNLKTGEKRVTEQREKIKGLTEHLEQLRVWSLEQMKGAQHGS